MITRDERARLLALLHRAAHAALARYGIDPGAGVELSSYSENTVFKVSVPRSGQRLALRIHRPNYHSPNAIRSELAWMQALNAAGIGAPRSIDGIDGDPLQEVWIDGLGKRTVTALRWIDGRFPDESQLEPAMRRLGSLCARLHAHARSWRRPDYFERIVWDHETTTGPAAHWGRWEDSPGLAPADAAILRQAQALAGARLAAFGKGPERFGLIHADQRLANLLVDGDTTHIIDFDDCGLGWFLHDLAAGLSFIEHRPDAGRLIDCWTEGYTTVGTLSAADIAEFPTFILQRRLQLLAWRGSHFETDMAQGLGDDWVAATAQLGARYLRTMG
jgi:Ser/Thr protein kinase RdoA (MazF antagonist)